MSKKMTFEECLKQRKAWYKTLDPLECPVISEEVKFTSKGFNHLKYNGRGRTIKEYHQRLWLLPFILPVIQQAKSVYEYKSHQYSKKLGKYFEIWEIRENVNLSEVTGKENLIYRLS